MAKPKIYNVNIWEGNRTRAELLQIRRAAAKATNQRMVRLERGESLVTGEKLDFGAIEITRRYLKETRGDREKLRFSESLNQPNLETLNDIKKEIAEMQRFLNSKSSTVKGMHDIERKRIATFEEAGVTFASNKEFYDFFKSDTYKDYMATQAYSSEHIVGIYQRAREVGKNGVPYTHNELIQAMEEYKKESAEAHRELDLKSLTEYLGIEFVPVDKSKVPKELRD